MARKITTKKIEKLANEIRQYLIEEGLWVDTRIYFNGKAYSTDDGEGRYWYNDPKHLIVLENQDPCKYFDYCGPYLSMSFEGPLYSCLNYCGEYGRKFEEKVNENLRTMFASYGLYMELGNSWNLSLYDI